jgi:hypothetical protein
MDSIAEQKREEALLMDIIANNPVSNNPVNEQDQREAESYLNMFGDGIEAEEVTISEQPVDETRNDGQPSEVYLVLTSITIRFKFTFYIYVSGAIS